MTDLLALAAQIEAADGPSRELDRRIFYALQHQMTGDPAHCPYYTASIDAALTLVPEGAFWSITMRGEKRGGFHACCQITGDLDWREAATPALALCAAALKACAGAA